MLGFGPIGTLAVATGPNSGQSINFVLVVDSASYALTVSAVSGKVTGNISPAAYVVAAQGVTEAEIERVTSTSFAVSAKTVAFGSALKSPPASYLVTAQGAKEPESEIVAPASFTITAAAVKFADTWPIASASFIVTASPVGEPETEVIQPASIVVTASDVVLKWTGASFPLVYGGVGHYLVEIERAKQLAAITRKIPPALDLRSQPRFAPISGPPVAPPAPAVDLSAIMQQRMAAEMQAAQAAKKRRTEQAILLLAS